MAVAAGGLEGAAAGAPARRGVLLVNLGSPETATRRAVAAFLREFLLDRRVVELPRLLWWPLLNGLIIPLRAGRVARSYRAIWTAAGSPLRVHTRQLSEKLELALSTRAPAQVRWALTYGRPGIAAQLRGLQDAGAETIVVVPLFPQYSGTTTAAVYDQVADFVQRSRRIPDLRVVNGYADFPDYIAALAASVRAHWARCGRGDRLLISCHGIPLRCVALGDPYPRQCEATAQALAAALRLEPDRWQLSYQSRFGRQPWLQPYTDETLLRWAREGIATVDVICPAFATDGLETLAEIAVENARSFRAAGGAALRLVPCLNADARHVAVLSALIEKKFSA